MRSFCKIEHFCGKLDLLDLDSFTRKVTQFYQPTITVKADAYSDLETETSPSIVSEDILIEEKKNLNQVGKYFLFYYEWKNYFINNFLICTAVQIDICIHHFLFPRPLMIYDQKSV